MRPSEAPKSHSRTPEEETAVKYNKKFAKQEKETRCIRNARPGSLPHPPESTPPRTAAACSGTLRDIRHPQIGGERSEPRIRSRYFRMPKRKTASGMTKNRKTRKEIHPGPPYDRNPAHSVHSRRTRSPQRLFRTPATVLRKTPRGSSPPPSRPETGRPETGLKPPVKFLTSETPPISKHLAPRMPPHPEATAPDSHMSRPRDHPVRFQMRRDRPAFPASARSSRSETERPETGPKRPTCDMSPLFPLLILNLRSERYPGEDSESGRLQNGCPRLRLPLQTPPGSPAISRTIIPGHSRSPAGRTTKPLRSFRTTRPHPPARTTAANAAPEARKRHRSESRTQTRHKHDTPATARTNSRRNRYSSDSRSTLSSSVAHCSSLMQHATE